MIKLITILTLCTVLSLDLIAQDTLKAEDSTGNDTGQQIKQNKSGRTGSQVKHGRRFVDKDGDGYNDNAPDHDGDGIPNGLDPDYMGSKSRRRYRGSADMKGESVNDNSFNRGNRGGSRRGWQNGRDANDSLNPGNNTGSGQDKSKGNFKVNAGKDSAAAGSKTK
jgi:hypothetical protein